MQENFAHEGEDDPQAANHDDSQRRAAVYIKLARRGSIASLHSKRET